MRACADRQLGNSERRSEVAGAEDERLETGGGGDPLALDEAARRFDLRFRRNGQAGKLVGRLDLGQDDDVRTYLANEGEVGLGAAVDPDRDRRRLPVVVAQRPGDELARLVLPSGGDRVLEIEDHFVAASPAAFSSLRASSPGTVRHERRRRGVMGRS